MPGKIYLPLSPLFLNTTTDQMDLDRLGHNPFRRRKPNHDEPASYRDPVRPSDRARQQPRSSPLPQTEWSAPSSPQVLPYRTYVDQYHDFEDQRPASASHAEVPHDEVDAQGLQQSSSVRQRSRKRRAQNLLFNRDEAIEDHPNETDVSLLYPQLNPYDDHVSVYSAPEDFEHMGERLGDDLVSPLTPGDFSPVSPLRSPTYPPATRSRSHNSAIDDAALADAEEFHLFVQATAGFGFYDEGGQINLDQSPVSRREAGAFAPQISIHETAFGDSVSPIEEASMTLRAMQHLAQIPDGSNISFAASTPPPQPTRVSSAPPAQFSLEDFEGYSDDLPDYEESQNQHWSSRRLEATRRAQELAMRWRLTGARRGIM